MVSEQVTEQCVHTKRCTWFGFPLALARAVRTLFLEEIGDSRRVLASVYWSFLVSFSRQETDSNRIKAKLLTMFSLVSTAVVEEIHRILLVMLKSSLEMHGEQGGTAVNQSDWGKAESFPRGFPCHLGQSLTWLHTYKIGSLFLLHCKGK